MLFSTWNVDASQILSRQELAAVLKDMKRRARRLPNVQMNLAIVRLACCCGLRASEIGGLTLGDVRVGIARPHLLVHALAGGRTLAEVKAAAGHASLLTTSVYLHVVVDEREEVGELFQLDQC